MPSDAAFREALWEYRLAFTADKHEPNNGPVPHCAGCDEVRRTGEIRFRACGVTVTHNNRRKDASRALVALLRRKEETQ